MRLTVLGGSAACPNPGQGSSAYLLEVHGQRWMLDAGPNTILELRKHVEIDELDRIFISHVHADHTLDLVPLRYGLTYAPGIQPGRIPLCMPPGGMDFLQRVALAFSGGIEGPEDFFTQVFDVQEYDPDTLIDIDGVTVRFFPMNHPVACWAMRIESDEGSLVYLADTGPQDDLIEIAQGADILICEGTMPDHDAVEGVVDRPHLSAWEAGCIARKAGVREFILTHLWATAGFDRYLEAATDGFKGQVTLARPGVQVRVDRSRDEQGV